MQPRKLLSALALSFITVFGGYEPVLAQKDNTALPRDPAVVTGKLSNGLTYYIRKNRKPENKVELRLAVKAGSILETEAQLGLAHFMEHMNFNGTKNFQKNELVSYLQSIGVRFGADLNAYTSFDETVYILPIPTDKEGNLEKGFQIIEDWAHNALLTEKDIDEERGVVLEESRLGKGADDRMLAKFFPKLASGSLYASRLPIGKDSILKHFQYETVRSFYKDWYRPDLQAVIVVGDIEPSVAKQMIEKHFGGISNPANEKPRNYIDVKPRSAPDAMVVTDKEASYNLVSIDYPYTKKEVQTTVEDYRKGIVRNLALAMLQQRYTDLMQSSTPPFSQGFAQMDSWIHGYEAMSLSAVVGGGDGIKKAVNALTAEVVKANKYGFTASELDIAGKNLLSGMEKVYNERNTTESGTYVGEYIRAFLDNECYPGIENEYSYLKSMLPTITLAEANEVIKQLTSNPNTFTLVTAAQAKGTKLPTDNELKAMTIAGFKQQIAQKKEVAVAKSLLATKPTPGKVTSTVQQADFGATTITLSNGITVTIKPTTYKTDEILVKGMKKGGNSNYGGADRSNFNFATDVVDEMGYAGYTPTQLEKILAGKTVTVDMTIGELSNEISAASTVKDFETMMQLLYAQIMLPRKDPALFKAYKEKQIAQLQFMMMNPQVSFIDTFIKSLFNNNPLTRMTLPKKQDIDKIDLNRAFEIYKNEFGSADGYHFYIVGNVDVNTAIPLLETYLGSIPTKGTTPAFKDNGVRAITGTHTLKYHKGSEKKSMIVSIYSGAMTYSEESAFQVKAMVEALNIKVIEIMREKMSAIYGGGFNGALTKEPYQHFSLQLVLPCGPENVDTLMAVEKQLINNMIQNGPDDKDMDKVKNQWIEKFKTDSKENKYWLSGMSNTLFWGGDKDYVLNYEKYVNRLTPADLQNAAKKVFSSADHFTGILYPDAK
ncbi:MAG: insulinase family protein [Chitinophagia bacterium]|nr:insulinase family protein [Chitinophagia bacterium]